MKYFFLALGGILFLWSCQPAMVFTKKQPIASDSVLFYQQQPISNPFLDSLSIDSINSAQLDTLLVPPPVIDSVRTADGFRVQLFAGLDSLHAESIRIQAMNEISDSVYVLPENGLYKTQAGDYLYRTQADSLKHILLNAGMNGAWVAHHPIFLRDKSKSDSLSVAEKQTPAVAATYKYTIQVMAVTNESKAQSRVKQLIETFRYPVFYIRTGSVFKLFVGKFQSREKAEKALKEVRANEYPDAWLVY